MNSFIDLNHRFFPLAKGQAPELDRQGWLRSAGGSLDWADLRARWRVVLLAEAACGKTEELRAQAARLRGEGAAGFFLRIEDLADERLEDALDGMGLETLQHWRASADEGWFFLDSVDEARLHGKSLERALRAFQRALGPSLDRAHVFISCRASDWRVRQDRRTVMDLLPEPAAPPAELEPPIDRDDALLAPIFGPRSSPDFLSEEPAAAGSGNPSPLIVQLTPLSGDQRRQLATAAGVKSLDAFMNGIEIQGLDAMAERPGDLLELVRYWEDHRRFGSLRAMTEHAVAYKLSEQDPYRPDNTELTEEDARRGAERIAAALTLGRSFTLLSQGDEVDPALAAGALEPKAILPDWTPAKRGALLRRGVFTPATYGRLRFHHRGAQEYLTASWLNRLLQQDGARSKVWSLIFVERYGVETVVPSLRAVAAWMALDHPDIRDEIIRREPLSLIVHGDPRSLAVDTRSALLQAYANASSGGSIPEPLIGDRAIWLFSEPALAPAIERAWPTQTDVVFRQFLLRCIGAARIVACAPLARQAALEDAHPTVRMLGVEALAECRDTVGLELVARQVMQAPEALSARVAASFAIDLFPAQLDVPDLLALIDRCGEASASTLEGFAAALPRLLRQAGERDAWRLTVGLARAALASRSTERAGALTARYGDIVGRLAPVAQAQIVRLGEAEPSRDLIEVLRVIALPSQRTELPGGELQAAVRGHWRVNRALLWASVTVQRSRGQAPTRWFHLGASGGVRLWGLGPSDLDWLAEDVRSRDLPADRELALSAIVSILHEAGTLDTQTSWLDALVEGDQALAEMLRLYRAPREPSALEREFEAESTLRRREQAVQSDQDRDSWRQFRDDLVANPGLLSDPANLTSWRAGVFRLLDVGRWLASRSPYDVPKAVLDWRRLGPVFSPAVAVAFREGLTTLWRTSPPARPRFTAQHSFTTSWTSTLAVGGLNIEAAETAGWADQLSEAEVQRAAGHGVMSSEDYPPWLDGLLRRRRTVVMPVLTRALQYEWRTAWGRANVLTRLSRSSEGGDPDLTAEVARCWVRAEPVSLDNLERGVAVLVREPLSQRQARSVLRASQQRYEEHLAAGQMDRARLNLAVMLALDPQTGVTALETWLARPGLSEAEQGRAFSRLFGQDRALLTARFWEGLPVALLERIVRLAYRYVPRAGDPNPEARRTLRARDDAQQARSAALNALAGRTGHQTFASLMRLAEDPAFSLSARRLRELAHERAESDSEAPAWQPAEVIAFEGRWGAPAKTGADLLRVTVGVLDDIQLAFTQMDATSRAVAIRAADESEVQTWLAEQLNLRAQGRYRAARETEVAGQNKPDIIVSSTTASVEVALEVKHGGMRWTPNALRQSLTSQLTQHYLLPETRRQGVFVVTRHGTRTWRDPTTGAVWQFADLIRWLARIAEGIDQNIAGAVDVRVLGLDLTQTSA